MSEKKIDFVGIHDSSVSHPHTFISDITPDVYVHGPLTQFIWLPGTRCVLRTDNIVSAITVACDEAGNLV